MAINATTVMQGSIKESIQVIKN